MTAMSKGGGMRKGKGKKSQPKPPGMSREVYALLGNGNSDNLPPMVATKIPIILKGRKTVLGSVSKKLCARWVWVPFKNSARKDDLKLMHWVKEGVEYPDYPYARYNVKIPHVSYTSEQYSSYLDRPGWTRTDTDKLVALCRRFNLCWTVIADRAQAQLSTPRPIEQLQHRYYDIASRLRAVAAAGGGGAIPAPFVPGMEAFNLQYEKKRRKQMHGLFLKSKDGEQEEAVLRKELKQVEANIKKLRQNKDLYNRIGGEMAVLTIIQGVQNSNTAKGYPFLQSQRLASAMQPLQPVSKALLNKVKQMLAELHVPEKLMPTKAVCDLYDMLLLDILTMFVLQKIASRKETELLSVKYTKPQGQDNSQLSSLYSAPPSSSSIGATISELSISHKKRKAGGSGTLSSKVQRVKK
eukprot:178587_1